MPTSVPDHKPTLADRTVTPVLIAFMRLACLVLRAGQSVRRRAA